MHHTLFQASRRLVIRCLEVRVLLHIRLGEKNLRAMSMTYNVCIVLAELLHLSCEHALAP